MKAFFSKKCFSLNKNKTYFCKNIIKNFSQNSAPEILKETNLKGYINYFRKHSFKYANTDPLNLKEKEKNDKFQPDHWELSEIEKLEEFPVDNSYSFNEQLLENATVLELKEYLHNIYLKNVNLN